MTDPSSVGRLGDLQVSEDVTFQNRMWSVQRVGWAVGLLILLAAALGLLGEGVLAQASSGRDGFTVSFERIERHRSPSTISLEVSNEHAQNELIEIWVERMWLEGLDVQRLIPEPESVESAGERVVFTFEVQAQQPVLHIGFEVMHQALWMQEGSLGVVDGPTTSIRQFVLP